MTPRYIIIHHSLTPDGTHKDWDAIRRYHMETNRWQDVGYHFGVERIGDGPVEVMPGRPDWMTGAHCRELAMNTQSLGICVVGNYDLAPPPVEYIVALRDRCLALMEKWGIASYRVLGHREVGGLAGFDWRKGQFKTCPGSQFDMDLFRAILKGEVKV